MICSFCRQLKNFRSFGRFVAIFTCIHSLFYSFYSNLFEKFYAIHIICTPQRTHKNHNIACVPHMHHICTQTFQVFFRKTFHEVNSTLLYKYLADLCSSTLVFTPTVFLNLTSSLAFRNGSCIRTSFSSFIHTKIVLFCCIIPSCVKPVHEITFFTVLFCKSSSCPLYNGHCISSKVWAWRFFRPRRILVSRF